MLTYETFVDMYPEFRGTEVQLVVKKLNAAALRIKPAIWKTYQDEGHGLLAAHLLSRALFGKNAKLKADEANRSTYQQEYRDLTKIVFGLNRPMT